MDNLISFYHFNTKDAMDTTSLKDTDIAFCKETRSIRTHGMDYLSFEWDEIPDRKIGDWIKEHMVFYYDMSKPMDYYEQNFTQWTKYSVDADVDIQVSTINITRFTTANDVVGCYIPSSTMFYGLNVEVKGLTDGQWIYWGYSADNILVKIDSDGSYYLPWIEETAGNLSFRNGNITGACNVTITQTSYDSQIPSNGMLGEALYLQDFSGNNRRLKLKNFLFKGMSGVGGNDIDRMNIIDYERGEVQITSGSNSSTTITIYSKVTTSTNNLVNIVPTNSTPTYKFKVSGLEGDRMVSLVNRNGGYYTFGNGVHEVTLSYPEGTEYLYNAIGVTGDPDDNMKVEIELIPRYPNALVTDGVDDYGEVENAPSLSDYMLFVNLRVLNHTQVNGIFSTSSVDGENINGWALMQANAVDGQIRIGNSSYGNFDTGLDLSKRLTWCLTNKSNKMTCSIGTYTTYEIASYPTTGNQMGLFTSYIHGLQRYGKLAFYGAILLDTSNLEDEGITQAEISEYVNKYILNS